MSGSAARGPPCPKVGQTVGWSPREQSGSFTEVLETTPRWYAPSRFHPYRTQRTRNELHPNRIRARHYLVSMQALQQSRRALARAAPFGQQSRNMSAHGSLEDNSKSMKFWTYCTFLAIPPVAAYGFYTMSQGHHHAHDAPSYAYLKKRDRKFPWGSSCDLFDFSCSAKAS